MIVPLFPNALAHRRRDRRPAQTCSVQDCQDRLVAQAQLPVGVAA